MAGLPFAIVSAKQARGPDVARFAKRLQSSAFVLVLASELLSVAAALGGALGGHEWINKYDQNIQ